MNRDKLEALRALAADPRTPDNEARNAALTYVRGGGQVTVSTPSSGPSVEELRRQLAELEESRDGWRKRALAAAEDLQRFFDLTGDIRRRRTTAPRVGVSYDFTGTGPRDPFQDIADILKGKRRPPL